MPAFPGVCVSEACERPCLWRIAQTVQAGQLGQLREAPVVDAQMQVLVQDAEILIAALHDPASALQNTEKMEEKHKLRERASSVHAFSIPSRYILTFWVSQTHHFLFIKSRVFNPQDKVPDTDWSLGPGP